MIAIFCGRLLDGGRPTVFGDGRQTRDYIYVRTWSPRDADRRRAATLSGSFNVGRGVETSVLDLVETLRARPRRRPRGRLRAPVRAGAAGRGAAQRARPGRAREVLGFEAKVGLEEGLGKTLAHFVG